MLMHIIVYAPFEGEWNDTILCVGMKLPAYMGQQKEIHIDSLLVREPKCFP